MTAWLAAWLLPLQAQGLAGTVPVTGQDGDKAALNRVALGTQLVSVWKDSRALGKIAAEAAIMLADGKTMADVPNVGKFPDGAREVEVNAVLLTPNADHQGQPRRRHRRRLG